MADTNTVTNVSAGAPNPDGAIFRAPIGTTLPTDAATALGAAFVPLGFVSDEGLTNSKTLETEAVKDWGGRDVLTLQTDKSDTFQFTSLEILNIEVLKMVFGDANVSGTLATGITVKGNASELSPAVYVIDLALRDGAKKRIVIPNGSITELGDVVYAKNSAAGYPVTIKADTGGFENDSDTFKEYILRASTT